MVASIIRDRDAGNCGQNIAKKCQLITIHPTKALGKIDSSRHGASA
jgi:hypothetical protein